MAINERILRPGALWAVFIGINDYNDPVWGPLPYCENDASELARLLTDPRRGGYPASNVRLLTNSSKHPYLKPSRANIIAAVSHLAEVAGADDSILFGFFGHGWEESGVSYIIPSDGWLSNLRETAIALKWILDTLQSSSARFKILIFDACHVGALRGRSGAGRMSREFAHMLFTKSEGWAVLSACKANEESHDLDAQRHGVFTYYLLEGLKGPADTDGDGFITVPEASRYASLHVKSWAFQSGRQQSPTLQYNVDGEIVLLQSSDGEEAGSEANEKQTVSGEGPLLDRQLGTDCANAFELAYSLVACAVLQSELTRTVPSQMKEITLKQCASSILQLIASLAIPPFAITWKGDPLLRVVELAKDIRAQLFLEKGYLVAEAFWLGINSSLAGVFFSPQTLEVTRRFRDEISRSAGLLGIPKQTTEAYLNVLRSPLATLESVGRAVTQFGEEVIRCFKAR